MSELRDVVSDLSFAEKQIFSRRSWFASGDLMLVQMDKYKISIMMHVRSFGGFRRDSLGSGCQIVKISSTSIMIVE